MATKSILTIITVAVGIAVLVLITIWLLKRRAYEDEDPFEEMEGDEFEKYCAQLLEAKGYEEVEVTSGSHDYGVDILADRDGISYAIQCKCYSEPIGIKAIQEVYAGKDYYGCMVAVVMTNQYFTKTAEEFAEKLNVMLWDGDIMKKMIMKYGGGFELKSKIVDTGSAKPVAAKEPVQNTAIRESIMQEKATQNNALTESTAQESPTRVKRFMRKEKLGNTAAVKQAVDRVNQTQTPAEPRSISDMQAEFKKMDKAPDAKTKTVSKEQEAIRMQIEARRAEAAKIQEAVRERVSAEADKASGKK